MEGKVAYKKRKRRHKQKWNYKRIAIASTGAAMLIAATTILISLNIKAKSETSPDKSGMVANAAQNNLDKRNNDNSNTIVQSTNTDKQKETISNQDIDANLDTNADANLDINAVSNMNTDVSAQDIHSSNQTGGNQNITSKTSKGYSITEADGVTYVDGVLIANKTYALPSDYNPGAVDGEVLDAFSVMQNDAAKEGLNLYISSGFRSYETQNRIYNNYVAKDGKAEADRYSARAGHSEHQTGLCFDLNSIDDSFAATPEGKWVDAHAWEYGFIIRYPKGKENVTGYMYESWHLRYLGKELAKKVYDSGLCLEEYYGITSQYE